MSRENKTSEAQIKASKKWNQENKDYLRIRNYRSKGIKFIKEYANKKELEELRDLIELRLTESI